ncbi:unnamed protein product [Hymenolepis diminuta]|uniref:PKS_AT domain-containing protein n=1 Tax=Hymenolepis diminuta TaxID=6216 RepID=A0A0R3SNF3_HYMDI|nr:unnamed protein product [Hymenolepis diminuta]VUZ42138.1 unnamed protein product [Hymenolepis diminuta]
MLKSSKLLRPCWRLAPTLKANYDEFDYAYKRGEDGFCQFIDRPSQLPIEATAIFLFPGQGAQFVGMGKNLLKYPGVKEMYETASSILRTDLLKTCLEGPADKLRNNIHCQPAIYVTSLAAVKKIQHESPKMIENCVAAAGYSVGEIAALTFAGSFTFEEGLHLVRVRAEAMQKICEQIPGGMLSVRTTHESRLYDCINAARNACPLDLKTLAVCHCQIAAFLAPEVRVVSGTNQALEFIENHYEQFRLKSVKRLDVEGPYHTVNMEPAMKAMIRAFGKMEEPRNPKIPVLCNYDVKPYHFNVNPLLAISAKSIVYWEQILHCLYSRPDTYPFPVTVEVGPGRQLGVTLRLVNRKAFQRYQNVEV